MKSPSSLWNYFHILARKSYCRPVVFFLVFTFTGAQSLSFVDSVLDPSFWEVWKLFEALLWKWCCFLHILAIENCWWQSLGSKLLPITDSFVAADGRYNKISSWLHDWTENRNRRGELCGGSQELEGVQRCKTSFQMNSIEQSDSKSTCN